MADVQAFSCWLPDPTLAAEVAALPYDVFSRTEAAAEIAAHPRSFLRIDKSCALLPACDEYDPQVYTLAAELLAADERAGIYQRESMPNYYLYRLEQNGVCQTGVVTTVATDDYRSGVVRRHENTRALKRSDRIHHIEALQAQTGPVFLTYHSQDNINRLMDEQIRDAEPLIDFIAPDGVRHSIWRVDDLARQQALTTAFAAVHTLYIADGHHRAAAAAAVGSTRFLAILFPSHQLHIYDYNRVIEGLNGLNREDLLARIGQDFEVTPAVGTPAAGTPAASTPAAGTPAASTQPFRPTQRGEFGLYLRDGAWSSWYVLRVREGRRPDDAVSGLDVSILHDLLLGPQLKITDPRSDPRISYVGGVFGLEELERRVDALPGEQGAAFALYPCTLDELFAVADSGRLMPPKSTWFEPKPRSGLFIYPL
ncbi:MAG: DUF1015 family protein [Coriobacteriales bacterium]|nr:DUF1015 family protein [Coriobacteriales bacterium]